MPQVLDIEQSVLLLELEPPFDKRAVQLVRAAAFGFDGWVDVYHVGALLLFAVVTWRLAIHYMSKKLID